ncbi:MAG: DUF4147 domain-containing protein [Deltaproteobacteria bacterium]|nr:DUF4147 domain-containing protein [Deltaproteobacteria bacterium]
MRRCPRRSSSRRSKRAFTSKAETLEAIFREALERVAPERLVFDLVEPRDGDKGLAIPRARFDVKLAERGKLRVFGAGKAVARMAEGALAKLRAFRTWEKRAWRVS